MLNASQRTKAYDGHAMRTVFLSLNLMMSATVVAGGSTVPVPPPNGSDDTANIQAALDACVARGPGCTVQLQAGRYLSRQLVAYNFRGTFRGMGLDRTTIEVIFPLSVTLEPVGGTPDSLCQPNTTTCLWPDLIIFVNGDIHVSDLSLNEFAPPGTATTPWGFAGANPGYVGLFDLLAFMGQHANAYVDRTHVEGLADPANNSVGFNVVNGVHFTGEFPRSLTPFDWYFLSGSYTVRNSSFKNMGDGVSQDAFVKSTHITVGGSPTTGNHFEGLCFTGIDMETSEDSIVEVSYNESTGFCQFGAAMSVTPWFPPLGPFVATSSSQYFIHDNKFFTTSQFEEGILLLDDTRSLFIDAVVWNNTVELQNRLSEGIGVVNTKGTTVLNNSVIGSDAFDAIGLSSTTRDIVINNSVSGVTIDSTVGNAQIFLDPGTSQDFVLCATASDTVLNQGTDNAVVRCQQQGGAPAAALANVAPRVAPTRMSRIHKGSL
jgi:hypothetical protein